MIPLKVIKTDCFPYFDMWELQKEIAQKRIDQKIPDILLLTEHFPVITVGKKSNPKDLLLSQNDLTLKGVQLIETDRGGELTFHGPGQIVGYPILDLSKRGRDVELYLRKLENVLIQTLHTLGIPADRRYPWTGVWLDPFKENERKIASIGVHIKKWVSTHGFALNVNTDLNYFSMINPCGIENCQVTSIDKELDHCPSLQEVQALLLEKFIQEFNCELIPDRKSTLETQFEVN